MNCCVTREVRVPRSPRSTECQTNIYLGYGEPGVELHEENRQRLGDAVAQAHVLTAAVELSEAAGRVDAAMNDGNTDAAKLAVSEGLRLYPWNEFLHRGHAIAKLVEGDIDGAIGSARAAAFLDPLIPETWALLAEALTIKGWMEEARLASFFAAEAT